MGIDENIEDPAKITVYGTSTCPGVPPVLTMLRQSGVPYDYVNIGRDPAGEARVRAINHGDASVPTLVFPDGSTLTEPSTLALRRKLQGLGYRVSLLTFIQANFWLIIIAFGVLLALLTALGVI